MSVIVWLMQHYVVVVTTIFVLIAVTTYWPGRRASIERHGLIALDDDR